MCSKMLTRDYRPHCGAPTDCGCVDRRAYNALAMRDNGELKQGLDMAKKLQRAILRCVSV
jgi:hypothetical protein